MASHSLQKMVGKFCTIVVELYTWEFLQVPTSTYSGGFYIFTMHIWGLGFKVRQIHRFTHWMGGKLCTIVVELFTWEFLQVSTSFCINSFKWILYSRAFNFQHLWCCSIVFASSYKFLHQLAHMWFSMLVLFENLALTSFRCYC
jgi:hypothetical protein